jgi:hypothetical protein
MEIIVISEGYQETRQHEKDSHADMELQQKALHKMREVFVEGVFVMRNEYQVGR